MPLPFHQGVSASSTFIVVDETVRYGPAGLDPIVAAYRQVVEDGRQALLDHLLKPEPDLPRITNTSRPVYAHRDELIDAGWTILADEPRLVAAWDAEVTDTYRIIRDHVSALRLLYQTGLVGAPAEALAPTLSTPQVARAPLEGVLVP
ncbi:hypothetical protein GCM10022252_75060 [Streptosporangium oxazolinicum]|uniref:Uncharacterized protein n=1 Tax=Streptosporangium oxazolinicum TaxID=909287 RepID=A0ABP8BKP7_9ACTN